MGQKLDEVRWPWLARSESDPRSFDRLGRMDPNWRPGMDPALGEYGQPMAPQQPDPHGALPTMWTPSGMFEGSLPGAWPMVPRAATGTDCHLRTPWEHVRFGQRIRHLRLALGWTQNFTAAMLGVSRRTVIRHELGDNRHGWVRLPLRLRVRELEWTYADKLAALLARAAGPSEVDRSLQHREPDPWGRTHLL